MLRQGEVIEAAQQKLKHANGKMDSSIWIHKLSMVGDSIQKFKEAIIKKYPGSLLSILFIAMRDVKVPLSLKASKEQSRFCCR